MSRKGKNKKLKAEHLEQSDIVGAIVELARKNEDVSERLEKLEKRNAEQAVQRFIDEGRLLAKTRKRAVRVYLAEGLDGLEDLLAPEGFPFIKVRCDDLDRDERRHNFDIDAEIDRLSEVAARVAGLPNRPGR